MAAHKKPHGRSGPIEMSSAGAEWKLIEYPGEKAARELMVAKAFADAANRLIMLESLEQPTYRPFSNLIQNDENDLDFTITTSRGSKRMDLVEFAPLNQHGPQFKDAPPQLDQVTKSDLLFQFVRKKSAHQGGPGRLLLFYITEHGFWLDPITIEIARRALDREPPRFERIYYVTPSDKGGGMVWEIFPGKPHVTFGTMNDEELRRPAQFPHPHDFSEVRVVTGKMLVPFYGECAVIVRFTMPGVIKTRA